MIDGPLKSININQKPINFSWNLLNLLEYISALAMWKKKTRQWIHSTMDILHASSRTTFHIHMHVDENDEQNPVKTYPIYNVPVM